MSAVEQRNLADDQRSRAQASESKGRQLRYAAEVNLAQHALQDGNVTRARELLLDQRPSPGQEDLRGFEWRFLWDQCRSDELATLTGHTSWPQQIALSPDGKTLASADQEGGVVRIWDVVTRRERVPPLPLLGGEVRSVAFSRDGKQLAVGTSEGKIKLWDVANWQEVATLITWGWVERIDFSPDGKWLAAGVAKDDPLNLWDLETKLRTVSTPG